jgi:hypothetical protein
MKTPRTLFGGLGNQMFQMAYIYAQMREGKVPDIYLQNYKYFDKYRDEIREWYGTDLIKSDYVSLHIRRGDYVNNPFYVDLTQTDYYDKAIAEFPDEKFLVFCADRQGGDDMQDQEWVMNWLEAKYGNRFTLFKGFTEIDDFNNQAGCKAHIIANSSFSWWCAYVSGNKTIAPSAWFSKGDSILLLKEWKKL